jgi:glycerol-3-phosphate dehydrogenase
MAQTYQKNIHNPSALSGINRTKLFQNISLQSFDIVIIGGGITGAGLALDAASRGLKTLLVEKNEYASGTSSRSTKLIHGGLRYLKNLQFRFVSQLGRERKTLLHNFPFLVIPSKVILPVTKGGSLKFLPAIMALKLYDILAGVDKQYRSSRLSKKEIIVAYPFINKQNLRGGFLYYEYKTSDGRLTVEILKTATAYGALALNYCLAAKVELLPGNTYNLLLQDTLNGLSSYIKTTCVINATGIWCDLVAEKTGYSLPRKIIHSKGIHLVFSKKDLPVNHAFYMDATDGRMIFIIPKQEHVYVGTTDTFYSDNLELPQANPAEARYLIDCINQLFPELKLSINQVISSWAGIRPLIGKPGKNPGEISRREEIFKNGPAFITITGGKLTGFRLMAKKTIDLIYRINKWNFIECKTSSILGSGNHFRMDTNVTDLTTICDQLYDEAKQTGIGNMDFKELFYRYGSNVELITEKAFELLNGSVNPELVWLEAEIWYSINYEQTVTLSGFLIYKTDMVLFQKEKVERLYQTIALIMEKYLSWQSNETKFQIDLFTESWNKYRFLA